MADARPGRTPPFGTSERIRNRAIWAVAFFAASILPAVVGMGVGDLKGEGITVAMPIALGLWAIGALFARGREVWFFSVFGLIVIPECIRSFHTYV